MRGVTILDINKNRLAYLDDIFMGKVSTLVYNEYNIAEAAKKAEQQQAKQAPKNDFKRRELKDKPKTKADVGPWRRQEPAEAKEKSTAFAAFGSKKQPKNDKANAFSVLGEQ